MTFFNTPKWLRTVAGALTITVVSALIPPTNGSRLLRPLAPSSAVAHTLVSETSQLGTEAFWNFLEMGLGAGWNLGVNTHSGNLVLQKQLVSIPGRGPSFGEAITYNSRAATQDGLGTGWILANDLPLQENADLSVTLRDGDGTSHTFTRNPDGSYARTAGVYLTLQKLSATVFTVVDKAQSTFRVENGHLASVTDQAGNALTITRDAALRITQVRDASARILTYAWDVNGRLTSITDPADHITTFGYDASNRLASVTDPNGQVTRLGYNAAGILSSFFNAKNENTKIYYDASGRVDKIADARSTPTIEYATAFAYDPVTLITTVTNPAAKVSSFKHNSTGNVIESTDENGNQLFLTWNHNNLTNVEDAKGTLGLTYDGNGNITREDQSTGSSSTATTTYEYDSKNNTTATVDPNLSRTQFTYDSMSNLTTSSVPVRREADANTYDQFGNATSKTMPGVATYNLLENGSFEKLDIFNWPVGWSRGGNIAAIIADDSVPNYGATSMKMHSLMATTAYLTRSVSVAPGQKLTLSAETLTQGLTGGGAAVGLEFYDALGSFITSEYSNAYTGSANHTMVVTADAPAGAATAYAVLLYNEAAGTVWFDGIQLESPIVSSEGHILSRFDYVSNSSFEFGGSYWYAGGLAGAAGVTTQYANGGSYSGYVSLGTVNTAHLNTDRIGVRPGEALTLSGVIKTVGVSGTGADIQVQYYSSLGTYLGQNWTQRVTGTSDWTRYAVITTPPADAAYAHVFALLGNSTGAAYFDNVKLVPRSTTLFEYDANGNYLTSLTDTLGNTASMTYDAVGNRTAVTDPKANQTTFAYDQNNNLTAVTDALGKVTRLERDPLNLTVSIRDARSASPTDNTYKTTFTYDPLQKMATFADPLGRTTTQQYDTAGNLSQVTNPDSSSITFQYDGGNRMTRKAYSNSTVAYDFSYDGADNLTGITDDLARSYTYSYDNANRLTSSTDLWGYQLDITLDSAGNATRIADSELKSASYHFGSNNRLLSLTDTGGLTTRYRYDDSGRVFEAIRGNGVKATYTYDNAGRISQIADLGNPDNSVLFYRYDQNSNISESFSLDGRQAFGYDGLNRLTSWTDEAGSVTSYSYDAVGNLTGKGSQSFTYNAANQITNPGYTYDANGNLTSDGTNNYQYDGSNRLVRVTRVAGGAMVAEYEYDYRDLRIKKVTPTQTIRYHWDAMGRLVRESDANGNTLARYIWKDQNQLAAIEKGGSLYYPHFNYRGDVLAVTDSTGTRVATYEYGPWGELLSTTGTFQQPWRYAGYYYDEETGFYYLKARHYSPNLGRFLTKDPLYQQGCGITCDEKTLVETTNLYSYSIDNPITFRDPEGTFAFAAPAFWWAAPAIGKAVGWAAATFGAVAAGTGIGMWLAAERDKTAADIIAEKKKGAIHGEFPKEMYGKTLKEIEKLAKAGNKAAQKAKKLLTDKRFDKGDNRK